MASQELILESLANELPLGTELDFYHVYTPPTATSALFSAPPGQEEKETFCESHFLAASLPKGADREELLVFGIEVLVVTTQGLTTIFVSKADSTGYLHLLKPSLGSPSTIKTICTTFLSTLVKDRLQGPRVLLSLFARSQNQYLFPGSSENPGKHVLDDRQLIKWWCRTLDPVLREYDQDSTGSNTRPESTAISEAFILVPGCDRLDTRAFFPPSTKSEPTPRWSNSYPLNLIAPDTSAPPRCLIPRFPDDPKARFLVDLDSEIPDPSSSAKNNGRWRSVKTLDQFWDMMSYRQECSAGRLVGFIWVVFTPSSSAPQPSDNGQQTNPDMSASEGGKNEVPIRWPKPSRGQLLLSSEKYQDLMTHLLEECDFANTEVAARSTREWIEKAAKHSGDNSDAAENVNAWKGQRECKAGWGRKVFGRKEVVPPVTGEGRVNGTEAAIGARAAVNVLTGVRKKKRKIENGGGLEAIRVKEDEVRGKENGVPADVEEGTVRKKRKAEESGSQS
jgi:Histone acetylation protein